MEEINLDINELLPINELKQDINLVMFNSKLFSVNDMILNNKIMDSLKNLKINIKQGGTNNEKNIIITSN